MLETFKNINHAIISVISLLTTTAKFTCVARGFTGYRRVVVVVLHPHRRHHNSAHSWLAGFGLRSNTGNAGLTVLIAASHIALFYERTAVVARGMRGRRAVHVVTTALLLIIRHALGGQMSKNLDRLLSLWLPVKYGSSCVDRTCWGVCMVNCWSGLRQKSWCSAYSLDC